MDSTNDIDGSKIIKKEAKGIGDKEDFDLGEVQEVDSFNIITEKGTGDKESYRIPRNLLERFDGDTVYFKITKEEAEQYKKDRRIQ